MLIDFIGLIVVNAGIRLCIRFVILSSYQLDDARTKNLTV